MGCAIFINANLLDGDHPAKTGLHSGHLEGADHICRHRSVTDLAADDRLIDLVSRILMPA